MLRVQKPGKNLGILLSLLLLCSLLGKTPLLAAEAVSSSFLTFACDGTAREQAVLQEQSTTWIINQTRAFAPATGRVVYRVPVRSAQLESLRIEANFVP